MNSLPRHPVLCAFYHKDSSDYERPAQIVNDCLYCPINETLEINGHRLNPFRPIHSTEQSEP